MHVGTNIITVYMVSFSLYNAAFFDYLHGTTVRSSTTYFSVFPYFCIFSMGLAIIVFLAHTHRWGGEVNSIRVYVANMACTSA